MSHETGTPKPYPDPTAAEAERAVEEITAIGEHLKKLIDAAVGQIAQALPRLPPLPSVEVLHAATDDAVHHIGSVIMRSMLVFVEEDRLDDAKDAAAKARWLANYCAERAIERNLPPAGTVFQ